MLFLLIFLFFMLQALVLFCCLAAGNDPVSQEISDQEQIDFLNAWRQTHNACK